MIGRLAVVASLLASIIVVITFMTGNQYFKDFFGSDSSPPKGIQPASFTGREGPRPVYAPPRPILRTDFHPSFDCRIDRGLVEQAICSDEMLSAKDRSLAELYFSLRAGTSGVDRARLVEAQRQWLRMRSGCRPPGLTECVSALYDTRIAELKNPAGP
jgi:uncharacterized protein YecT (DUF1311 family)